MDKETGKKQNGISVKKTRRGGRRPPPHPDIKRHCSMLSPEETDEFVEELAMLIVEFIKKKGIGSLKGPTDDPGGIDKPESESHRDVHRKKE